MKASAGASGNLSSRSFHALKWNYLGNAIRASTQLLIGVVLARLLDPGAFGTVAVAWLMVGLGMLVADLGFSAVIIQRNDLVEQDVRFTFTMQVGLGALMSLAGIALGDAIAAFFHRPDAAPIIKAMALLFVIQSVGQTPLALLRRALDFKAAQAISIRSYVIGYVAVGVPCAWLGLGAWSLVGAQLVQSALSSLFAVWRTQVPMRPAFRPASRDVASFGRKVIGSNISSWGISNVDSFIVGRVLGVMDLGLYSRAMALVASPAGAFTTGAQGVLFAACSRAQTDLGKLKRAYLGAAAVVVGICLPVFVTISSVPEAVIGGVYGAKWIAATPVLIPLALAMPVHALLALVGPVLTAMSRVGIELRVQALTLALMVPVLYVTAQHSVTAIAWGMLGIYIVRCFLLVGALLKLLRAEWLELARALVWPAACAGATAFATWSLDHVLHGAPPALRLLADIAAAATSLLVTGRMFGRQLLKGPHGEFLLAEGGLPSNMRQWLGVIRGTP